MPVDILGRLSRLGYGAVGRLTVHSALNPLLWLSVSVGIVFVGAAYLFRDEPLLRALFAIVAVIPSVLTCVIAGYFAVFKPEKLQSEGYQLKQQTLSIIENKGGRIRVSVVSLEEIAAPPPAPVALPKPGVTDHGPRGETHE